MRDNLEIDSNLSLNVIQTELNQVKEYISECIKFSEFPIDHYMEFLFEGTDHFLGPALVLLSGRVTGGYRSEHIPVAAMIELIYRSSSLHNQINSVNTIANQTNAFLSDANAAYILLGDFLLSQVFAILARLQIKEVSDILTRTALKLIAGGLQRKLTENNWKISETDCIRIASFQDPVLYRSSCKLGAMLAGASYDHIEALSEYGYQLGMGCQIKDELQTVLKAQQNIGDDATAEDMLNKKLLPVVHCLNQSRQFQISEKTSLELLFSQMHKTDSINYTRDCIQQYADQAGALLKPFASGPYTKSLSALVESVQLSASTEDISA